MESIIYNQEGKEAGKVTLPEDIFGVKWNPDLVHQVAFSMLSSARSGTAHTKTRGEVRGGGKKPWKQKGTGRARHGSIRSPIWVGGGVAHGPRNDKNYQRKVNKKMKRQALLSVLSRKFRDGEVVFFQGFNVVDGKTKEARKIFDTISGIDSLKLNSAKNTAFIAFPRKEKMAERGFRNFGNVSLGEVRNLNVVDLLKYKYIFITEPEESINQLIRK